MKVPTYQQEQQQTSSSSNDDMFLFKVGEDRYLNSLLVSPNGGLMVCGDEVQKPFPLLVWNLAQRKLVYDLRQPKHEFQTDIQSISTSGRYVVCACQEEGELQNCLIVYDLITGQLFRKFKVKYNFVCVEISEEANVIIACIENAQIIVFDLAQGSKK
jgi:WD40 repeat protein